MVKPVSSRNCVRFASIAERAFLLRSRLSFSTGIDSGGTAPGASDTRPIPTDRRCPGAKLIRDRTSPPPSATLERRSARDGRLPRTLPAGGGGIDPFDVRGGTAPLLVSIDASVMRRCDMTVRKTATRRQRTRIHTQVT